MRILQVLAAAGLAAVLSGGSAGAFQIGDTGAGVRLVQQRLVEAGYSVEADGCYGAATADAVRLFQLRHHLPADGVAGPRTCQALTGRASLAGESDHFSAYGWQNDGKRESRIDWTTGTISGKKAKAVTEEAQKYIGVPYRFGGADTHGFDCSGFIQYVFRKKGVALPRAADEQYGLGQQVARNALQPGDLVFFSTYESGASHSGIYVGGGHFISATTSRGIAVADMTSGYWFERYIGAKRIL